MKKFLKCCVSAVLAVVIVAGFTGCKTKLSDTTVSTEKVKKISGVSTNGGISVVYGDYLYFINGTKTNDGTSSKDNVRSAVYRVSYNTETGKAGDDYERVVDDLVGYENGSLYFFGDFMYYTSPSSDVNYKGDKLYYKTKFMRYDLVNKKSYELYTTSQNESDDNLSYAYYIVGDTLNLLVYESTTSTLKSLKINKEVTENYTIEDIASCVLSENQGTCVTEGKTVDANNYVFYTKNPEMDEAIQTGVKVYRVSPVTNNSECIYSDGGSIALLTIRNGKLIYSLNDLIYSQTISGNATDKITNSLKNIISYGTYDNVIFIEKADGTVAVLYVDDGSDEDYKIIVADYAEGRADDEKINQITTLSDSDSFSLVGLARLYEQDEDSSDYSYVLYLVYIDTNIMYKLEIAREVNGEYVYSKYTSPVKLSTTTINSASGLIAGEIAGDKVFAMSSVDDDTYMYQIDLAISKDSTKSATLVGVKE